MTASVSSAKAQSSGEETCLPGASVADVLQLLGGGAAGSILLALDQGPLRTKGLTERVPGYTARTIYRYTAKLAALDIVEREEEPGVPSKVVYTLTEPCGRELLDLVNRFAAASLTRLPDGSIGAHAWSFLELLGDLWDAGMIEDLSCDPRSPTELAQGPHGLSYHQVNRRAGLFKGAGLLRDESGPGRRRCYALTERTRQTMGLIAGIGRWRHHHVVGEDDEGLTPAQTATLLRAALPLVSLPRQNGSCLRLDVLGPHDSDSGQETVWADVERNGSIHSCVEPSGEPDACGSGDVGAWLGAILDAEPRRLELGGEGQLLSACLERLHDALWTPLPSASA